MIAVLQHPIPDPEIKALQEWLRQPQSLLLRKVIRGLAAEKAADAGRLLCESDPKDREDTTRQDALAAAVEAKHLEYAAKLLAEMTDKAYKWRHVELQPVAETIS